MSTRDTGGQAFPTEFYETEHGDRVEPFAGSPGMTLRDYFAAQFLAGRAARTLARDDDYAVAEHAYKVADAMLAARSKP